MSSAGISQTGSFIPCERLKMYAQAIGVTTSFGAASLKSGIIGAALFALANEYVGKEIASNKFIVNNLLNLPTKAVRKIGGKFTWLAPLTGIALSSIAAYKLYNLARYYLVKGVICGFYSVAMNHFSYKPCLENGETVITLYTRLTAKFGAKKSNLVDTAQSKSIQKRSELASSMVHLVSGVAFTVLFQNPILGDAVAYPLAAVTQVALERFLSK